MTVTTIPNQPSPPTQEMAQPFVLSLRLDKSAEKLLTTLRTQYFPIHRNFLPAHVTLFHALPASSQPLYASILNKIATSTAAFTVGIKNPFPLGKKGVGINIASHKLRMLHAEMLEELQRECVELTEQDCQKLSPHVTVQNKVEPKVAEESLVAIKRDFKEQVGKAEGLVVWRYERNGEWTFLKEFSFQDGGDAEHEGDEGNCNVSQHS